MLLTNQRLDKIATCRADFASHGMLADVLISGSSIYKVSYKMANHSLYHMVQMTEDNDGGDVDGPSILAEVALAKCPSK